MGIRPIIKKSFILENYLNNLLKHLTHSKSDLNQRPEEV